MDFGKDWSASDTALLLAALHGVHADVKSTKEFLKDPKKKEGNPLLSDRPSDDELKRAEALSMLATGLTAGFLPKDWRGPAMGAWAGFEHRVARENLRGGAEKDLTPIPGSSDKAILAAILGGALGYGLNQLASDSLLDLGLSLNVQGDPAITFKKDF